MSLHATSAAIIKAHKHNYLARKLKLNNVNGCDDVIIIIVIHILPFQ